MAIAEARVTIAMRDGEMLLLEGGVWLRDARSGT
jgi:hypothetical protein